MLVMQAMFDDRASAVVVGAGADEPLERPLFEMVSTSQSVIPDTSDSPAAGRLTEAGFVFKPSKGMPALVCDNIERCNPGGGQSWTPWRRGCQRWC
ncbi:hypothetical protein PR202_ga22310 [Eleusine coracana subsp. coracana]|uniref:Uncharacterized protein n=1 Tax=Eleusine coracana subsp. coracana TaxID=191504 RepID=A0AAV5D1B8_ELECO|nr:hypothetical protein PR202_ga22310 [Eleusine coracana subsp. coracana]